MATNDGTARPVLAHPGALALLRSPLRRLLPGICALRFVGRTSGRSIALPVQYADDGDQLVVYVGKAAQKRWWRNFIDVRDVQVRVAGTDRHGAGRVVAAGHTERSGAEQIYRGRYPRVTISPANPMVVIDLASADAVSRPT